jgi:hypothetical protein
MHRILSRRFGIAAAAVTILIHGPGEAAVGQLSPVGRWTTVSDDDGKPEAVVEIQQSGEDNLS